jgi:hypothetical protein
MHMVARNTLDFATPSFLMVIAHSEKARLEQSRARNRIGLRTCHER